MPRRLRNATGGIVYHALNRAAGKAKIFRKEHDYLAFLKAIDDAQARVPTRVLAYCIMPNHFHLVLHPAEDGQLSEFMRLLTVTHTQRYHAHNGTGGTGPLYQGRFKSFPVETDSHLLTLCRYVERNPLRAKLVTASADWAWSSAGVRASGKPPAWLVPPKDWPVESIPRNWAAKVDVAQSEAEEAAVLSAIHRGRPLGSPRWTTQIAAKLGLESTLRDRGRPRKPVKEEE